MSFSFLETLIEGASQKILNVGEVVMVNVNAFLGLLQGFYRRHQALFPLKRLLGLIFLLHQVGVWSALPYIETKKPENPYKINESGE